MPSGSILPLVLPRMMDRTWGQDGGGSGCKRLFCCCGGTAKLVRSFPAVQPAPLRQDTPLIAAELGSPILEPNLQENLLITRTVTAVICCSAPTGGPQIKVQMQFVPSVHQQSERRPPTHNTHNYIQVKPGTFRSSLDAVAKLRKATISFVISVRPSVCLHGTTRLLLDGFSRNLIFEYFSKNCRENQVSLKSNKNEGYFT